MLLITLLVIVVILPGKAGIVPTKLTMKLQMIITALIIISKCECDTHHQH